MIRAFVIAAPLAVILAACTQFPELDDTQTADLTRADYPALIPIDPILAAAAARTPPDITAENARFNARLAALRVRAGRMRGSVLEGTERQRLERGLQ